MDRLRSATPILLPSAPTERLFSLCVPWIGLPNAYGVYSLAHLITGGEREKKRERLPTRAHGNDPVKSLELVRARKPRENGRSVGLKGSVKISFDNDFMEPQKSSSNESSFSTAAKWHDDAC